MLRSLRAPLVALTMVALGCGRGGLGEFDRDPLDDSGDLDTSTDTGEELDSDRPDTDISFDTFEPPPPDTFFPPPPDTDLPPPPDTFFPDTFFPPPDTDLPPPPDTFLPPDTFPPPDTFIPPDVIFPDTFPDDTSVFDTGFDTGTPEGGILCGGDVCSSATEVCCANFTGLACVAKGACMGGTTISCSSGASCGGGQKCCFGGLGGGTPTATCQPFCLGVILCDSTAECNPGQLCTNTFGGYKICR